ncbi:hypothetical protein QWA68_016518 [Fusarium oxysporum]|nr:hypothetical protein QWA68_016518 [Fusarium oxysporum]
MSNAPTIKLTNYEHLSKRHEALKKKVSVLQDWIIETVDQPLARHNFNEEESLTDWIKSIHEEFSLVVQQRINDNANGVADKIKKIKIEKSA